MCRSRRELSNAYFVTKFSLDTAENEPCQVCPTEPFPSEVGPSSWTGIAAPPRAADGWPDDCAGNKEEIVRICENLLAEVGFGTADNEPSSASNDFYLHVIFVQSAR